ncbi:hypothetical protein RIF23_16405 [Lipingzhangella sp. LS1_29]|uniref:Uncharacterized protein n=1 Tax=Lipingzhangella rawalii TaxID=2055835 RepID=A0ABU2H9B7_9ACTN|nr:hypothetical protein [Lipingzhangella rawalii]MDS1271876.1 hypothetical protein [Lipingzhangella rawalii]
MTIPHGPAAQQFVGAIHQAAANTPYTFVPTEQGFDLMIDLPRWHVRMNERLLQRTFVHRVKLNEAKRTFTITQTEHAVTWGAYGPTIGVQVSAFLGRSRNFTFGASYGPRADGSFGQTGGFTFDSEEGRRLISNTGQALGWTERMNTPAKIGLGFAVFGFVGALAAAVGLLLFL